MFDEQSVEVGVKAEIQNNSSTKKNNEMINAGERGRK